MSQRNFWKRGGGIPHPIQKKMNKVIIILEQEILKKRIINDWNILKGLLKYPHRVAIKMFEYWKSHKDSNPLVTRR